LVRADSPLEPAEKCSAIVAPGFLLISRVHQKIATRTIESANAGVIAHSGALPNDLLFSKRKCASFLLETQMTGRYETKN
jgi:hypothetical protein